MQSIERYGVVALLFLIVTVAAVLMWGSGEESGSERVVNARTTTERPSSSSAARASLASSRQAPGAVTDERARQRRLQAEAEEAAIPSDRYGVSSGAGAGTGGPTTAGIVPGGTGDSPNVERGGSLTPTPAELRADEEEASRQERERLAALEEQEAARRAVALEEQQARESSSSGGVPVYVVRSGEVLGVIAQRELGTVKRMDEIIDLNPGLNPDKIRAGLSLRMPADWPGAGSAPTAPAAEVASSRGRSEVPEGLRVYVVKEGESLWKIAANQLGSGGRYRELEELNPGIEGGRIVAGQELLIPAVEVALAPGRTSTPASRDQGSSPSGRRVR